MFVTLDWLAESIKHKQSIANCDPYLYKLNPSKSKEKAEEAADVPSPASKKNILSMTGNFKVPKPKRLDFKSSEAENNANKSIFQIQGDDIPNDEHLEDLLLDQYINADTTVSSALDKENVEHLEEQQQNELEKPNFTYSENQYTYEASEELSFLNNLTVHIQGFDEESSELLIQDCRAAGANVILDENYQGIVDYLIVSLDILSLENIRIKAKNVVNQNWLVSELSLAKLNKI